MASSPALIAIVDDDALVCNALRRLLHSSGYTVEVHTSGAAFLQSVQHHRPACVVLDLHMPALNGFEVQAQLQHLGVLVPIVVISGQATPEGRDRALRNGAFAFICKPVDAADLLAAINGALLSQRA